MLGYACHAVGKSAVFDTMFGFASSTITLLFGLLFFRYHATWQTRSYGPGGQRYATGGTVSTKTPPSCMDWICRARSTVCGPAFQAWSTVSLAAASPSVWSHRKSTPGETTSRS